MFSSSAAIGWQLCQMAQVQVQIFLRLAIFEGLGQVAALYKEVCGTNFETPPKKVKQQDGHTILGLDRRQKLKIT